MNLSNIFVLLDHYTELITNLYPFSLLNLTMFFSFSSFDLHLQHNLSKEEIDNLKNLKFSWGVPVIGVPKCKWIGTGENILEVYIAIGIPNISCLCGLILKVKNLVIL